MAPPMVERKERLHMLLSKDESVMLERLADAEGLTGSDVVRRLIRQSYAARGLTSRGR